MVEKGSVNTPNSNFAFLCARFARCIISLSGCAVFLFTVLSLSSAQTAGTGSIVGTVTTEQENAIADAKIDITNTVTGGKIHTTSDANGLYTSGPIQPGNYALRIEAKGFSAAHVLLTVKVGNRTTADLTLKAAAPVIQATGGTTVNIEQPTVQGVLDTEQVETLPINGRNFFDLAQLEPGVQIQDAGVLDPGKNGISSISLLGQFGRGTRVSVDGIDINDETVGAYTQNIPAGAIQQFQVVQSMPDVSTGLTSAGAVNVITRSGSNQLHGNLFGLFRDDQIAATLPGASGTGFQREQFGGNAGGAIIKDKVFAFADAERSSQNLTAGEAFVFPFNGLSTTLSEPYRDFATDERIDWNMRHSTRAFYRFNYFENSDVRPFGSFSSTQAMRSTNNTITNALGVDFNTGIYAHSLRFEYLKLRSDVNDATSSLSGIFNPVPGLGINIGASVSGNCALSDGGSYCAGPGWLGPQQNVQSDKLASYDGSRVFHDHIFHYGVAFNRIDAARLAAYSVFPQVGTTTAGNSASPDPTSYAADWVSLGNGIPFATPNSAFGFPGGGVNPDNRIEAYIGDRWIVEPKLTLTYGVHYVHDTGRSDSALGPLPELNQWGPGFGNEIHNPGANFAPQFGFAWDAGGNGKTVIRAGGGLFYANSLFNNVLLDTPARTEKGIFASAPTVCSGGVAAPFLWPTSLTGVTSIAGGAGTVVSTPTGLEAQPTFCGQTISTAASSILALSNAYQSAASGVGTSQSNGSFVGTALSALNPSYDLLYPGYRTPRTWQVNGGIEKEIRPGTIFSFDYIRSIGLHYLIGEDINHSGAARSFNQANAVAARDRAQLANGCPAGFGQATCMIAALGQAGAQAAYSAAGLDSNLQAAGGGPCPFCAFPGTNAITGNTGAVGGVDMLFPTGRSLYTGFQLKIVQKVEKPAPGVKGANFQFAYTYSKYKSQLQDQDFPDIAVDNDNPTRFTGPDGLDRRQQISFATTFDLPLHTNFAIIGHFYSPPAQSLELPELTNGGEIFATDWLGAGLGSGAAPEPLPNTQIGQFERRTNIYGLQTVLNDYNKVYAGGFTPAGACLVANNVPTSNPYKCQGQISGTEVMTPSDMVALGWVMPTIAEVAPQALGMPWLKAMDMKASWPFKLKKRVLIEPSVSLFNVFNFWNAFSAGNLPSAALAPGQNGLLAPNVVGGVVPGSSITPFRTSLQSGTYALGAPRVFEFGLHVSF
jgi:hypothetical protein